MTKEEIISYGKDYLHDLETACCSISDIHKEFVREAIKALEQETVSKEIYDNEHFARKEAEQKLWELQHNTSDDCVSRKELLKLYGNRAFELQKTHQTDKQLGINWCINTLNELPPVTPTQRWIPVSEKMPKEGETVLVCYQTQGGIAQSVCEWFDIPNRGIVWSALYGSTPIAWQPLPQPYEEKRGSENE